MKKKIALFANGWNAENLDKFIKGLKSTFSPNMYDIFVFMSHSSFSLSQDAIRAENAIYFMEDYRCFDGAVIFASGLNSSEALEQIVKRCKEADIPLVCQGFVIDGVPSVTINNYSGMKDLSNHLIKNHNVKKVKFIAGPRTNEDSNIRIKAVRDALEENGCSLADEDIVYADWERNPVNEFIVNNFEKGKEPLPDAFICANDPMAMFAVVALESLGYHIPEDVLVSGFDYLQEGRTFYPSLASVDQCYEHQGEKCAELLEKLINGEKVGNAEIPCEAAPGESSGDYNFRNEDEMRKMMGRVVFSKRFWNEGIKGRGLLLEWCILTSENYSQVPDRIKEHLYNTNGAEKSDFHVLINPQYTQLEYLENPRKAVSYDEQFAEELDVITTKTNNVPGNIRTFKKKDIIPGYTGEGENKVYILTPIRIESRDIGYLAMGLVPDYITESKYTEFANYLNRALEKYQLNIKLAVLNDKLSELMQKDALTNVKNRRAYEKKIETMDNDIKAGDTTPISIVMCDINNLKPINDGYGHDAGDIYIKNCCRLICETFKHSPIFRTGGDEFVVIIGRNDYEVRNDRLVEMREKMEELAESDYPATTKVSVATGIAEFDYDTDTCVEDVVKRADSYMYINKAEMKAKGMKGKQ